MDIRFDETLETALKTALETYVRTALLVGALLVVELIYQRREKSIYQVGLFGAL